MNDIRQQWYVNLDSELTGKMPIHWRAPWEMQRKNKIAPSERCCSSSKFAPAKALGLIKPATAVVLLSHTLAWRVAGGSLPTPITDFPGLLDPDCVKAILDGPLKGYAGATRAMTLRSTASFASRCLGLDARHLYIASKRVIADEPRADRSPWLRTHQEYWDVAHSLAPTMEADEEHGLDTAIWYRRAATAIIAVENTPRKGELIGLEEADIAIDDQTVSVCTRAALSKTGVSQVRELTREGSRIVIEYCERVRPFLESLGGAGNSQTALWLTEKGQQLSAEGVIQVLRRDMQKRLGTRVCCNYLRSANVSQPGLDQMTVGDLIGHRLGSQIANDIYAPENYREALADIAEVWEAYD